MRSLHFIFCLCFLIVFFNPSYANRGGNCGSDLFYSDEEIMEWMPLEEFVRLMHSLRCYSVHDFVDLKRDGDLPEGAPEKPLRVYPQLKGDWSVLWGLVRKARLSDTREEGSTKRKMTDRELQEFMGLLKQSFENEEGAVDGDLLEEDSSSIQEESDNDKKLST